MAHTSVFRLTYLAAAAAGSIMLLPALPRPGLSQGVSYPIVITDGAQLNRLGIDLANFGASGGKAFPNGCYYYGDGGFLLTVSNSLLAKFKARGFSRRSLCMALASGIRFNPETGQKLPTYISVNSDELTAAVRNDKEQGVPVDDLMRKGEWAPEPGIMSDELPMDVPDCFNRGVPYSDCEFSYDPITGQKLSVSIRDRYRAIGTRIERKLNDPATREGFSYFNEPGYLSEFGLTNQIMVGAGQKWLDDDELSAASFFDYSSELPLGFGYSLYADGAAGPAPGTEAIIIALDQRRWATEATLSAAEKRQKK